MAALSPMAVAAQVSDRPNIMLILVDDLGYSDLGCYGGEIKTPNLDSLAGEGVRFTQFYNCARSCPSRASLMTGMYAQQVGITGMGLSLSNSCVTIPEALKAADYQTGMAGKWHLSLTQGRGNKEEQMQWLAHQADFGDFAPQATYPSRRGFDEHWGTIWGVGDYFDPFSLVHNEEPIATVPDDFYMTDFVTEKTIDMIDDFSKQDKPFFMYVAYTAPHWPLHAKPEDIAKYKGKYNDGWDALRQTRYNRMIQMGLIDPAQVPFAANESGRLWENETNKEWLAKNMEVHAAMVDCVDQGVGKIIEKLKASGEYDNTIILFMSDNGASSENYTIGDFDRPDRLRNGTSIVHNAPDPGAENTYNYIGNGWAGAVNTPFRYWKVESFHGGVATPCIVRLPAGMTQAQGGSIIRQPGHFIDVMPTCLAWAGATYPTSYSGYTIQPLAPEARSLKPLLENPNLAQDERTLFWEHENGRGVRVGDWKLVALRNAGWELYNLAADLSETNNVAVEYPAKVRELKALWNGWAKGVGLSVTEDAPDTEVELAFYYPFDETLDDASDNRYPLTASANGYAFGEGKYGKSLSLDGNAQYLDLNTTGIVNTGNTQYTVCAWIYDEETAIPASGAAENGYYIRDEILLAQKDNNGTGRIVLYTRVENPTGGGDVRYLFNNFLGGKQNISTPGLFEREKWKHVAVLCDPVSKNVTYYVDGVRDVTVSTNTFEACTGGFRIGGHKAGKDYWHGKIDELYLFKGLLSKEDILKIKNNTYFDTPSPFQTNLENISYHTGDWTVTDEGLRSNLSGRGDGFALSTTAAGQNFVYEADVVFHNRNESAASLVFGSTNDLDSKNMYVANIHIHNGVTRLFKFQKTGLRDQEALDLVGQQTVAVPADNKFHLSVTALGKHIVYSLNGKIVANTADYTMGSVGGQNDAFTGHNLGLLSWNASCTYQNVCLTEITPATDPQLKNLSIQASGGSVEHNVMFDSTQYVSIVSVTHETQQVALIFEKKSPSTGVAVKLGDVLYPDGVVPLQVGNNIVTLECTNGNAKAIYRVIVIRRNPADSYYNEFDRPQYHWSIRQHWTNDPNGLVYYNGEYHLFHQHYPGIDWGPMHWGHCVSTDLVRWTELPTALYPDEYGTMFSGSAVVDENNTSGLFKNEDGTLSATGGMALIITADGNGERVTIAYSKDGRHFTKHEGVLIDWTEDPMSDRAFRDPKVFRYQNRWFMVIAGGPLRIYSSENLIDWTVESTYANLNTECPDMFLLPVVNGEPNERKWVLSLGGVYYKVGDFLPVNGKWTFVPDSHYANRNGSMNYGNDAYATQSYYAGSLDVPQRVVTISWQNFRAPNIGKDNGNNIFNGQMTLQTELSLVKDANGKCLLQQTPLAEYETLRDSANVVTLADYVVTGVQPVNFIGQSYEIIAEFGITDATTEVGFRVRSGNGYYTKIGYDVAKNQLYNDRANAGTGGYRDKFSQAAPQAAVVNGKLQMRIFVDRNCVELFSADNTIVGSTLVYPAAGCDSLEVFSAGDVVTLNASIFPMRSIWSRETPRESVLTFDAQNGTASTTKTVPTGSPVGELPEPSRSGYTFGGWYTQPDGGGVQYTESATASGSITLYAKWTEVASTGVEDRLQVEAKFYPSTFDKTVHLAGAEGCTLTVVTAAGAAVHTQKVANAEETIALEMLPSGLYFFSLEKDGKTKTTKRIKK
jgi:arylsulfatase